ncbi:MAG: hypothetical protein IKO48_07540 [Elusimicrobia bacterium]|nr:hypothetical protein [Elusimicrobiota bacterium]
MINNFLKKNFNSIKICAVFTAVCFLVSALGANLYALPQSEKINSKYEDVFNKVSSISAEYGKITSSKDAQSDITVINIQDLHCHPQTQRNIAKIIGQISDKYNLKRVYVEGGYGDIDVSWLSSIKDENIRKQVIEKLLEEGVLTGSEYYKLTSNNGKVELKGIDEVSLHQDNIKRLAWIINNQEKYKQITEKVNREISMLEKTYVNKRNEKFNKNIEKYLLKQTDDKKFYIQLIKYIRDINKNPKKYNNITAIRLEDYPNISKFMLMIKNSDTINIKKVKYELRELILLLKNKLPFGVYSQLLKETNNFTDNQKSLELINSLCAKENINLNNNFKEFVKLLNINLDNQDFNPIKLVLEERQLINEIRKALSYNNEEYEITFLSDFSRYFKDYLEYKLTDADWKYFEREYEHFRNLYAKYAAVDRIKEIENDFNEINKYYDINDQRNNIFVKNLLKDEKIHLMSIDKLRQEDEMLKSSKEVIIAVTGGFHSSELEQLLAKNDVNTIVITPKIDEDIKQANDKYIELINLQSRLKSQALSYTIFSSVTDVDKQKILISTVKDLFGGNAEKVKEVFGKDADLSLLDEKQIINTKEKNEIRNIIETAVDQVLAVIPQQGMRDIFVPNIDDIMLNMAELFVRKGFYFSKGMIFDIENSNLRGKDLRGIPAEIYSRMLPSLQKALLEVDKNFKGKFYRTASDIKPSYDEQAASWLRSNGRSINYFSIFAPLSDRNKLFNTLSKTPHIWEEIIFRAVPVSIAVISMSFPAISCLSVPVGLMLFAIFQYQFVKAHNISAWIKENNLDWKTSDILLATLFNIFPDKDSKEKFNTDTKKAEVGSQTRSRFLPTLLLSIPYLYSLFFAPSIAVAVLATIIGVSVHKYLNLILKNKLNIFDEVSRFAISPDKDFKIDSNYSVSLKNSDDTQKLISLLNGRKLSKEEAEILVDIILSNVEQYGYFIELLQQIRNRFMCNVELLVETLAERIDITNTNQLNLFKEISENLTLKWETVLPTLFKRMDLNNDANVSLIKYFISKNQYNSELSVIVVEKADFNNKNHLSIVNDLKSIKDDVLSAMMNKTDIKKVEHLSLILNSLLKAGYLFSFQNLFSDIIKEINLSDKQVLKTFSDFMKKDEHSLSDNNIKSLIQKINFEADEQVELLEFVLKKNAANIDLVFDVLLANNIDLNDTRYSKIFKIIIDKMLSKYSSHKDARKYLSSNIFLLPANSIQGKYAFSSLIDLLHNELIAHQNKYLKIVNGRIAVRVNENGTDPTLESILRFTKDIDAKKDLFDSELKTKFNGFVRELNFFKEMENRTPKISYTRNLKIADSAANNLTIEEFCKEKSFSLIKQTPNVFFDSRRYSFTSVLIFISKKLFNFRPSQHNPTYIMTTNTVDAEKLDGVIFLFDIYMKLLDENLYTLNKIDGLTDFSSQFDDIVYHTNLMINYLEQISSQNVSLFKRSLKNILDKIENNDTTIEEQKKPIESQSSNIIEDIPTINALANRIHQQANMSFVMKVMHSLSDYEDVGYNTLISKDANLISVYNLSAGNINPQVERFLSDLAENPDFSTDIKTPIFVKDNIVLWVAKLGAHSVRILIDFNEETKSILVDFHEGAIDDGSTIRIKMLDNILTNIGFEVKESVRDFESRRLPVGIVAKLNKDVGLTTGMDFNNIAKQTVILFNNAASLNNLISNKFQMRHNIDVAKLAIMDIYSRYYALSYIRSNFVRTRLNSRRNLNKILKSLELPLIPRQEQGFWTFLKIGMIRVGFIKTYGQNTIDKYINKPIERAFATGYLKIDTDGILKRDTNYNPLSSAARKMSEMLNSEPGNYQETDMLNQGALLSQIPQGDLNFTTIGKVGGYVVKTGYIKLNNGRLNENTKGEFLAVTILVDKNGILRYSSSELAGFPQNLKSNAGRISLNLQQLAKILETEGYKTYPIEPLNDVEILNYRSKLKEQISESKTAVAYGTIISTSKQKRKTVFGLMDNKNTSERNVYINKYASPDNVKEASQHQVSLFTGGSYSSHAAILLREYEKTAMIVNDSQIMDKDKKMRIKFYQSIGNVRQEEGLQVQDIEEKDIVLQENDIVLVDTKNNKLLLFENKVFKNAKGKNVLLELQEYIDTHQEGKIKDFIERYKSNKFIDSIIEYIYYQSGDNDWLANLLTIYRKQEITEEFVPYVEHRKINKKVLKLQNFLPHTSKNKVYRFGEKESLDSKRVGAKAAGQAKLHLSIKQLKKDTGIKNVASPNGIVIDYEILEKLLGEQYSFLYNKLETLINKEGKTNSDYKEIQNIISQITDLIKEISDDKIIEYIGEENLEMFKDKLAIVRSSGVGEDSEEHSAAGIAESYGNVEYDDIAKAIKSSLASFFSPNAMDYMLKSKVLIKPTILIEEWINADKAGIMMSEDTEHNRLVQVINGQGDDIVSGRINPYSFVIDIKSGKKIDGSYTNKQTITDEVLQDLVKIMEWFEQTEGYPVDIEFLIKDNIVYIVQVRPITTLVDNTKENQLKELPMGLASNITIVPDTTLTSKQKNKIANDTKTIKKLFEKYQHNVNEFEYLLEDFIETEERFLKADKENINTDFISLIKNKQDLIQITNLMKEILRLKINKLETENNLLGIWIFLNDNFNNIINTELQSFFDRNTSLVHKYYMALAISRFIINVVNVDNIDYYDKNFNEIIKIATKIYVFVLKDQKDRVVVDKNTKFISLSAASSEEQPFEDAGLKKLLEIMNIPISDSSQFSFINANFVSALQAKSEFLKKISMLKNEESVLVSFDGHGLDDSLSVGFGTDITSAEFAKALISAYNKGMNLSKITINLSSCYSWYFANNVYETLSKEFDKLEKQGKVVERQFPIIWASSGHEAQYGYSTYYKENNKITTMSNEWNGLITSIAETHPETITVKNILQAMTAVGYSNPTLFVYSNFAKKNIELAASQILNIFENSSLAEHKLSMKEKLRKAFKTKQNKINHISFFELSVFAPLKKYNKFFSLLHKFSPIWEEIFFRTLPASFAILPTTSLIVNFLIMIIFTAFQIQFLRAHNISLWIHKNNFNWTTSQILKAVLFNVFPNNELKDDFNFEQQINMNNQTKERILPTAFLSVLYIYSIFFAANIPVIVLVSVAGIVAHKFLNSLLSKEDKKEKSVAINYRNIKASEIEKLIETKRAEEKSDVTEIYILDDIENLSTQKYELVNTGIKVDGAAIFKINIDNVLIYGALNTPKIKIAKTINESNQFKREIKNILGLKGEIEIDGIVIRNGGGIGINDGLLEIGEMELPGKNGVGINDFMLSALEVKRTIGITFGQKTIIDLKQLSGQDLLTALENGRTRKVITEEQFRQLNLDENKILELRKNGIEIYVVTQSDIYKNTGISGKIIEEKEKFYIYDYYTDEKIEVDVLTAENGLEFLEQKIINSDKPIMIDIEILKENFQGKNVIEAFEILGTLLGKIKITMGLRNLNGKDIENIGYNIRFDKIPEITFGEAQKLLKSSNYMEIMSLVGEDSEFGIILKSIRDKKDKRMLEKFIDIIKERILVKSKLIETGNEFEGIELKDKKLERLLGVLLIRAEQNNYETLSQDETEFLMKDITGSNAMNVLMESMKQLEISNIKSGIKDSAEQEMLVNKIIQIILFSDRINGKQTQEQVGISDISSYRAMLAAA